MLVLFETPSGYALFKLANKGVLKVEESIADHFSTPEAAAQAVKLKAFSKFEDTTAALSAAASICDGKLDKSLKKFLKSAVVAKGAKGKLGVSDPKLGNLIKEKLGIKCVYDNTVHELLRGTEEFRRIL